MKILGIDTILHNVCVSIVENGNKVLINNIKHLTMSSDKLLDLSVSQLKNLGPLIKNTLDKSDCKIEDISLIAVNNFGSLISGVEVGVSMGNLLSNLYNIPIINIHHQEAHIFSNWIERDLKEFNFPIIVFSASGGHSSIAVIKNNSFEFEYIHTIEGMKEKSSGVPNFRGVGAIYSFIAHCLGLGKKIDSGSLITEVAKENGDPQKYVFSSINKRKANNFDFSDLEKEIENIIRERKMKDGSISKKFISDIAASFEYSITNKIISKLTIIAERYNAKEIHLVGGISANKYLRKKFINMTKKSNLIGRYPKKNNFCTDNAAMIACLGYYRYKHNLRKYSKQRNVGLISNLKLERLAVSQYLDNNNELC